MVARLVYEGNPSLSATPVKSSMTSSTPTSKALTSSAPASVISTPKPAAPSIVSSSQSKTLSSSPAVQYGFSTDINPLLAKSNLFSYILPAGTSSISPEGKLLTTTKTPYSVGEYENVTRWWSGSAASGKALTGSTAGLVTYNVPSEPTPSVISKGLTNLKEFGEYLTDKGLVGFAGDIALGKDKTSTTGTDEGETGLISKLFSSLFGETAGKYSSLIVFGAAALFGYSLLKK